jgi:hypothetical protein
MDNGLIFPYPRVCVRDESFCANHPILLVGVFGCRWWGSVGSWLVVVE